MTTIPQVVEDIISDSLCLEGALSEEVINYSALARKIKPEVEQRLSKEVQLGAVLMALRRLTKTLKPSKTVNKIIHANNDLIVRSNLTEFVIANADFLITMHEHLIKLAELKEQYFITITEGVFETTIIVSSELSERVEKVLTPSNIISVLKNLSSITIRLPISNVYAPGLYYFFLKALAWKGINVIEVVSSYTELTIILENKDVDRAFSALKRLFTEDKK